MAVWLNWIAPLALLALQNIAFFFQHYFADYGFPWDFLKAYYGMTAFWTSLWSQGIFPSWVPFYSAGMPMDLLLQSGEHYPPLWIFPLLKIPYTLHAAVVFQCLHVLFGAIGMYLFLRQALPAGRYLALYAALGAFFFQFFGGFYSNAEHVDIIRAYALAPWLLFVFSLREEKPYIGRARLLLIPLFLLLLFTGAYAGNLISSALIIGLYVLFQVVRLWQNGTRLPDLVWVLVRVGIFSLLGVALSMFHLGPSLFYGDYLVRSAQLGEIAHLTLGLRQLVTLFLSNRLVPGEISMTSFYITLPAVLLLTYLPLCWLKEKWPMTGVLLVSFALVMGPSSVVWYLLGRVIPVFQLSRFPSSDYRAFLIICLIYFAVLGLRSLVAGAIRWTTFMVRTALASVWFGQAIYINYPVLRSAPLYAALAVFVSALLLVFVLMRCARYKFAIPQHYVTVGLIVLTMILAAADAVRVLPDMVHPGGQSTWRVPAFSAVYERNKWPLVRNGHLLTYDISRNLPARRPARLPKIAGGEYDWEGFITGRYTLNVKPRSAELGSNLLVMESPVYSDYMLREWLPVLVPESRLENNELGLKVLEAVIWDGITGQPAGGLGTVTQTFYGFDQIRYQVSLKQPLVMIENEPYFSGWTATLVSERGSSEIAAVPANSIFRAWHLPAGSYSMVASFELPGTRLFRAVSIAALVAWVLAFWLLFRRLPRRHAIHKL